MDSPSLWHLVRWMNSQPSRSAERVARLWAMLRFRSVGCYLSRLQFRSQDRRCRVTTRHDEARAAPCCAHRTLYRLGVGVEALYRRSGISTSMPKHVGSRGAVCARVRARVRATCVFQLAHASGSSGGRGSLGQLTRTRARTYAPGHLRSPRWRVYNCPRSRGFGVLLSRSLPA